MGIPQNLTYQLRWSLNLGSMVHIQTVASCIKDLPFFETVYLRWGRVEGLKWVGFGLGPLGPSLDPDPTWVLCDDHSHRSNIRSKWMPNSTTESNCSSNTANGTRSAVELHGRRTAYKHLPKRSLRELVRLLPQWTQISQFLIHASKLRQLLAANQQQTWKQLRPMLP